MRFYKIVCISFLLSLNHNCKKYPEDKGIMFNTAFKRLTSHSWKIKHFYIDNVDYRDSIYHSDGTNFMLSVGESWSYKNMIVFFTNKTRTKTSEQTEYYVEIENAPLAWKSGAWGFQKSKNVINGIPCFHNIGSITPWTIKALTLKHFVCSKITDINQSVRVEFEN